MSHTCQEIGHKTASVDTITTSTIADSGRKKKIRKR